MSYPSVGMERMLTKLLTKNPFLSLTAAVIITFQGVYQLTWFTIIRVLGYLRVCEQTCVTANRWKVHNYAI